MSHSRIARSKPHPHAEARVLPSGAKTNVPIGSGEWPGRVASSELCSQSQRLILPSSPPVARTWPSGENATAPWWVSCLDGKLRISLVVIESQSLTVPSLLPVARTFPSGDQARDLTTLP